MKSLERNDGTLTQKKMSTSFYDIGVKDYGVNGIIALEIKEKDANEVNIIMLNKAERLRLAILLQEAGNE